MDTFADKDISGDLAKPDSDGGQAESMSVSVLHDTGLIAHQDYYLAQTVGKAFDKASPLCLVLCALTSNALTRGHVCINLEAVAGQGIPGGAEAGIHGGLPDVKTLISELRASGCVGEEAAESRDRERVLTHPLILDRDKNLYLAKYFDFQQRLIENIRDRVGSEGGESISPGFVQDGLERLFSGQNPKKTAGQRHAVEKALAGNFLVISGGPGTGKTHVTSMIRSLLEDWHRAAGKPQPVILSMAPTGKAAERLENGRTIHAALKPRPRGVGFVHGRNNPLQADLVIVDEASMIDMALMARLMEAVPGQSRLVLLGDRDQLSPVQAGSVFSDLCRVPGLENTRAFLTVNFRSAGKSGIDALSRAVNENDTPALVSILKEGTHPDIQFMDTGSHAFDARIIEPCLTDGYRAVADAGTPEAALDQMDGFRVLCAHTLGPAGTLQVNHLCEKLLCPPGADGITSPIFKQIVMVGRNTYDLRLFNGDTGVVFSTGERARVWFRASSSDSSDSAADRGIRGFQPEQIPALEPAFAVTIHKSQGSEFDRVLILIPDRLSPVVTRQLLYTGITRARSRVIIAGSLDLICRAVNLAPDRRSNLAAGLERGLRKPKPQ
jgi:exodeoxyribonuclease V alpha subunit